jgi:glutathione S-transferase
VNYEALVYVVIAAALIEYLVLGTLVGRARGTYDVPPPATTGNATWERMFRAHQNTAEQLIIFVPSVWIFGSLVSAPIACALGLVFIVGRALYFRGYTAEAAKRGPGFLIGGLATIALLLGSLIGAGMKAFE